MKRIPIQKVKYTHITDTWDGPLSGYCTLNGKRLYFSLYDEKYRKRPLWWPWAPEVTRIRVFRLYSLPDATWKILDEKLEDFRNWVGTHWDLDEHGKQIGPVAPQSTHHLYYDKWDPKLQKDVTKSEGAKIIAYYVEKCRS